MLEVVNIQVSTLDLNYSHLTWELRVTGEDPLDWDFYILRSGSIGGPYDVVTGPIRQDTYDFLDGDLSHQARALRPYFYRIRAVRRSTGETKDFPKDSGSFIKAKTPLHAIEIQRQSTLLSLEADQVPERYDVFKDLEDWRPSFIDRES